MTGDELITIARKYVEAKTKWRHQGRDPKVGLDCVGLLYAVAWEAGILAEDVRNYSLRPGSRLLVAELLKYCDEVPVGASRNAGDILVVSVAGEDPQHTELWTGQGTVLHSSARHRKVVEHRFDDETRRGLCRIFRLRGLNG